MTSIEKLQEIRKIIQHGEMTQMAEISGVHVSIVSNYLKNGHRIVLNKMYLNKILWAWDKIKENKFRNINN
jgi:enoyl reductase-like protein